MKTIIDYYVFCFDRYLSVEVDERRKEKAEKIIDSAYDEWVELVEDDSCCEEYILQQLDNAGIKYNVLHESEV